MLKQVGILFMNDAYPEFITTESNDHGETTQTIKGRWGTGHTFYSKVGLSGKHEWNIKCERMQYKDMIGVVSSLEKITKVRFAFNLPGTVYFWWAHSGVWKNDQHYRDGWNSSSHPKYGKWDDGDIVTLRLDTDKQTLTLMVNGKLVFEPLELLVDEGDREVVWYPFVQASNSRSKYIHIV